MQKFSFSCTHVDNIKMNIFYICRSYVELSAALEQGKELNKEVGDSIIDQDLGIVVLDGFGTAKTGYNLTI